MDARAKSRWMRQAPAGAGRAASSAAMRPGTSLDPSHDLGDA
jgi:hypothetical protein